MKFRPMKFRTFIIPLALAAGLVLVLGVGLLGGLALRTPLYLLDRGGQAVPQAFQFVPKQSVWVASVLARPDRLAQLWDYLADPKQRQNLRADRERLERALLAQTGLTYEQDLLPWIGEEITVAMVSADLDQDPSNGRTPGYLAVLSCQDVAKARTTLELFWQNRALGGERLTFEDLGGTRLIYSRPPARSATPPGGDPLATALVANRFILVANNPVVLRQAIVAAQAKGDNLSTDGRYKIALNTLSTPRVGLLAVNVSQMTQWLPPAQSIAAPVRTDWSVNRSPLTWGLISLGLQRQGVLAEAAWVVAPGHRLTPHEAVLKDWYPLARYLPGSLSLEALGLSLGDLGAQLQPWIEPWVGPDGMKIALSTLVDSRLGQGATRHVVESFNQPYALGLDFAATQAGSSSWLLIGPNRAPVQPLSEFLNQQADAQGLGIGHLEILGYPTTLWTRLSLQPGRPGAGSLQVQTDVVGLSAEVGPDQVLTTSPELMEQALAASQQRSVPPPWTDLIQIFPQAGEGYAHLNWPSLEGYLRQQAPQFRLWETLSRPVLKHVNSLTLTSYGQTDQVHHAGLFIQLKNS